MSGTGIAAIGPLHTAGAFQQAVGTLMPAMRGYARRLTRDRVQSEDLVQETLLRAWAARHRFIPDTNLKAWLFRIQYNCFLSLLRKNRRTVQLSPELAEMRLIAPAAQEEGLMMRDFHLALASLTPEQAAALTLINDEQLRYEDAAERVGVALGTMKSRTARARSAVRRYLNGDVARTTPISARRRIDAEPISEHSVTPPPLSRYEAWKASGCRTIG